MLQKKYPHLKLMQAPLVSEFEIRGELVLDAEYKSRRLVDQYRLKLLVPMNFPDGLPRVYDLSEKVSAKFEHFLRDGAFCLGTETDILLRMQKRPTLTYFVDEFVISYLYASTYFNRYGTIPFPERPHGFSGIYDFYKEYFSVKTNSQVLAWLMAIILYQNDKMILCPCGSNRKVENCIHRTFFKTMTEN